MKNKFQKVILCVVGFFLSLLLLFNVVIIFKSIVHPDEIPSILGYKPFIVVSNSMEKTIYKGDLLVVKNIDASNLEVGDIIAYKTDREYIVHRIAKVNDDNTFKTKGDNNALEDDYLVKADSIEGVYVTHIPYLGNILLYLSKTESLVIILLTIGLVGTVLFIIEEKKN